MDRIFEFAKELSLINGISSREDGVRNYIIDKIKDENPALILLIISVILLLRKRVELLPKIRL